MFHKGQILDGTRVASSPFDGITRTSSQIDYQFGPFRFPVVYAAGVLADPYTEAAAVGSLDRVDTNSVQSTGNGKLRLNGALVLNDRVVSVDSYAHQGGRAFGLVIPTRPLVGTNLFAGATPGATGSQVDMGIRAVASAQLRVTENTGTVISAYTLGGDEWSIVGIKRATAGGLLFTRNGLSGQYKLLFPYHRNANANYLRVGAGGSLTADVEIDDLRIVDLTGVWATDWGLAANHTATPSNGEVLTAGSADGHVEITWTPASNEVLEIQFRRTDDDNCWIFRADEAADKVYLYQKQAGVETERGATGGVAYTLTPGSAYRFIINMEGATIRPIGMAEPSGIAPHLVYTAATFNQTATGVKVSGFTTAVNLTTWNLLHTLPAPFDVYLNPETTALSRVSEQTLWSAASPNDWLGRPVLLDDGSKWIALYRQAPIHGDDANGVFHLRFSTDEGVNWSADDTFTDGEVCTGAPFGRHSTKAATDGILFKAPNGNLLVHINEMTGGGTYQYRSTDGGKTWTDEGRINNDTTLIGGQDVKVISSTIYVPFMVDADSNGSHPWTLALYTSDDNGATWTKLSDIEASVDSNEPGLLYTTGNTLICYSRDVNDLNTYRYVSSDLGATWGAREAVTSEVGRLQRPRCRTSAGFHWLFGREVRGAINDQLRTVVYRSSDGLDWEPRFYPFTAGSESTDNGYCDMLLRANGDFYLLSYAGSLGAAAVTEAVFEAT